jgi:hypothetical protein
LGAPLDQAASTTLAFKRDAGGSRTHSKAALQAAAVPSGSSVKCPRQESNLDLNLRRVACPSSTPRGRKSLSSPPRSRTRAPTAWMRLVVQFRGLLCDPAHSRACVNQYPELDLNQGLDLRRVQCVPLHHRDMQSRRLDLHQHLPPIKSTWAKTGALRIRATSANRHARCRRSSLPAMFPWNSLPATRLLWNLLIEY